jgi:hypothetical protein
MIPNVIKVNLPTSHQPAYVLPQKLINEGLEFSQMNI